MKTTALTLMTTLSFINHAHTSNVQDEPIHGINTAELRATLSHNAANSVTKFVIHDNYGDLEAYFSSEELAAFLAQLDNQRKVSYAKLPSRQKSLLDLSMLSFDHVKGEYTLIGNQEGVRLYFTGYYTQAH